jgi:hypothetical protein
MGAMDMSGTPWWLVVGTAAILPPRPRAVIGLEMSLGLLLSEYARRTGRPVVLVDDQAPVRDRFRALLDHADGLELTLRL